MRPSILGLHYVHWRAKTESKCSNRLMRHPPAVLAPADVSLDQHDSSQRSTPIAISGTRSIRASARCPVAEPFVGRSSGRETSARLPFMSEAQIRDQSSACRVLSNDCPSLLCPPQLHLGSGPRLRGEVTKRIHSTPLLAGQSAAAVDPWLEPLFAGPEPGSRFTAREAHFAAPTAPQEACAVIGWFSHSPAGSRTSPTHNVHTSSI